MAFVTLRDVARKAGVSTAAVSQILHGKGRFSEQTRLLVQRTVEEMGYVPDRRARSMRSCETRTVGILVPDLRNPYFADLVCSMEDELYRLGYTTLIGSSGESVERQDAFIENLLGQRIDGAIIVPQGVASPGVRTLAAGDTPVVFVDRRVPGMDEVPFVVSDPNPGVKNAVGELVGLGHRRIGYVAHPALGSFSVNERRAAFEKAVAENPDDVHAVVVDCDSTYESRRGALARLRRAGASAVICAYSPDALTLIGLLHDEGVEIGREMSLVSFDDISAFRLMTPDVSVVSQRPEEMGRRGVAMLLDRIASQEPHDGRTHYVPTEFHPRRSIGPLV